MSIFWTVFGEKQVLDGSWNPENWKGRLSITGSLWLDAGQLKGKLKSSFEGKAQMRN